MTSSQNEHIVIRGAKEHNLRNVDLAIPKQKLVVFTGVSGSGKSSLAFDTLYAEGQRRYVESLSSYARQFLGQMDKPKYETIRGLSPTIAIEQKSASNNPRSTVGTVTEVHDYLRVLYARIGVQHCTQCGKAVGKQSAQQIVETILNLDAGTKVQILASVVRNRKGEHSEILKEALASGFTRARIDNRVVDLSEGTISLDKKSKHDIAIIVDRVVVKPDTRARLTDSVETALRLGQGILIVANADADVAKDQFFSEHNACVHCGISFPDLSPQSFSFNSPLGCCPSCNGLGSRAEMDPDLVVPKPQLSIREGAIGPWASAMSRGEGWTAHTIEQLATAYGINLDTSWSKLGASVRALVLYGSEHPEAAKAAKKKASYEWEGVVNQLMRRMKMTQSEEMKRYYLRYFSDKPCTDCNGARIRVESRAVSVHEHSLDKLCTLTITQAHAFIRDVSLTETETIIAKELRREILSRLGFLLDVGLGYLTLDRAASTLSGGESQRIRLASQIGSELTGVIYVLDEPSIGLHQRDNDRLLATLKRLRDLGNSVIVVEHDEDTIAAADWIVDFGPGAGELGGIVVAHGTPQEIAKNEKSVTGAYLSSRKKIEIPTKRRSGNGKKIKVVGATEHNLKNVNLEIKLGTFTVITGVSGAGKSTLINRVLYPAIARALHESTDPVGKHKSIEGLENIDKVVRIDQKPIGRTPRSNPATYTKVFDPIRDVFSQTQEARAFGYDPGRFSFNVKGGRCEACQGDGVRQVEMHFLPDVYVTCDVCHGKRFNDGTLRVKFKEKNIADVLDMSVREALECFAVHKDVVRPLKTLDDVGLGYIRLGQSSPTLSGGEAQRIKLSRELSRVATGRTLYILDEPTTGLHFADIEKLLLVLHRLVDAGNTVVVIEHNLDVIKCADWISDLGPEGGANGGVIMVEGTPEQVAQSGKGYTSHYLQKILAGHHGVNISGAVQGSNGKSKGSTVTENQQNRA